MNQQDQALVEQAYLDYKGRLHAMSYNSATSLLPRNARKLRKFAEERCGEILLLREELNKEYAKRNVAERQFADAKSEITRLQLCLRHTADAAAILSATIKNMK